MIEFSLMTLLQDGRGRRRQTSFLCEILETKPGEQPGVAIWSDWHDRTWTIRDAHAECAYARALEVVRGELAAAGLQIVDAHDRPMRFSVPVDQAGLIDWRRCQRDGFYWIFGRGFMGEAEVQPFPAWSFNGWLRDGHGYEQAFAAMVAAPVLQRHGSYQCRFYSSLGRSDRDVYGRTADECYRLAFGMLRSDLDMRELQPIDDEGRAVSLAARFVWSPRFPPPRLTPDEGELPKRRGSHARQKGSAAKRKDTK